MPKRALRPCRYPGCAELEHQRGYCEMHQGMVPVEVTDDRHHLYGRRWRMRREGFLAQHPWCEDCLEQGMYTQATDVHHVTPHRGDPRLFATSPLRALCHGCHSKTTASEGEGGIKKIRRGER